MGCDIHMVLEQRRKDNGLWIGKHNFEGTPRSCFSNLPKPEEQGWDRWVWWRARERNYEVFNALAGVRGEGSGLGYVTRGIPDDVSELAQLCIDEWAEDGHSHSWLSIREAIPAYEPVSELVAERLTEGKDPLLKHAEKLFGVEVDDVTDLDNYRIVFWFDN